MHGRDLESEGRSATAGGRNASTGGLGRVGGAGGVVLLLLLLPLPLLLLPGVCCKEQKSERASDEGQGTGGRTGGRARGDEPRVSFPLTLIPPLSLTPGRGSGTPSMLPGRVSVACTGVLASCSLVRCMLPGRVCGGYHGIGVMFFGPIDATRRFWTGYTVSHHCVHLEISPKRISLALWYSGGRGAHLRYIAVVLI